MYLRIDMKIIVLFILIWSQMAFSISGGQPVEDHRFGGVIQYNFKFYENGKLWTRLSNCSGVAVGPNKILTAHHCANSMVYVDGWKEEQFIEFQSNLIGIKNRIVKLKRIELHPKYDPFFGTGNSDLAVLTTDENLNLPIYQLSEGITQIQKQAIITVGFGCDLLDPIDPQNVKGLLKLGFRNIKTFDHHNIVLEKSEGDHATGLCPGDSGGPAFIDVSGRLMIVGINSSSKKENGRVPPLDESTLARVDREFDAATGNWLSEKIDE